MVSFISIALLSLVALLGQANGAPKIGTACKTVIPGIYTNNASTPDCPNGTRRHLTQEELQCAMNDFAKIFYTEKDVPKAMNKYVASNYVQHNPGFKDGRAAAIQSLAPIFGNKEASFELARVMVGPEYTTVHIKAQLSAGAPYTNVFDVYRTQGSCILEHWDCLQPVIIDNTTLSTHPYF